MSQSTPIAIADAGDRHQTLAALAALAIALMFALQAVMHVVQPATAATLDAVANGLAFLAIALLAPMFYWKVLKLPREERHIYFSTEGFVAETIRRAQKLSWAVTFFLLIALETVVGGTRYDGYLTTLPPEFYLQAVLAVMLGVMAIAFLIFSREGDVDEGEARA